MFDPDLCPEHIRESIDAYTQQGRPTGSFLHAVLSNDLAAAVARADEANIVLLPHIVAYVNARVPFAVWGDVAKVEAHLAKGRRLADAVTSMFLPENK